MGEGPAVGAIAGFVMGLSTDLVLQLPHGVSALIYTIAGYVVGRIRAQLQHPSARTPMIMTSITTFCVVCAYGFISSVLGVASLGVLHVLRHAALTSVYNALLTPFVYPVVRRLAARMRPKGVVL
jgi:rod shape-determining protein MreD